MFKTYTFEYIYASKIGRGLAGGTIDSQELCLTDPQSAAADGVAGVIDRDRCSIIWSG